VSKFDRLQAFAGNINASIGNRPGAPGPSVAPAAVPAKEVGVSRSRDAMEIEVERIIPDPHQPRKEFEEEPLARLAESLKGRGQLQPIQVRWSAEAERYIVLTGERRWRAAQLAGLAKLRCIVRPDDADASDRLVDQLVENCLREDLTPMEQARAYRTLMDAKGWSVRQLAEELAISPGRVSQMTALLSLPEPVQARVDQGELSSTAAYEISRLDDPAAQIRLAETAAEQKLTREDVAKQTRRPPSKRKASAKLPTTAVLRLNGCRIEITRKTGLDPAVVYAALLEAAEKYRPEPLSAEQEAA